MGNKRLELSGQLLSLLFEVNYFESCIYHDIHPLYGGTRSHSAHALQDLFKTMNDEVRKTIDAILSKTSRSSRFDMSQVYFAKHSC